MAAGWEWMEKRGLDETRGKEKEMLGEEEDDKVKRVIRMKVG